MNSDLQELAAAHGVATSYEDWSRKPVAVSQSAVVAALAALDVDASSPQAITASLAALESARWAEVLPPVVVVTQGGEVVVRGASAPVVEIVLEGSELAEVTATPRAGEVRDGVTAWTVRLPLLRSGWHTLRAAVDGTTRECVLVVAPDRLELPPGLSRTWGWMVQLYSLRSAGSWAMGDYADLRTVVDASAKDGAGAVLLNPLHAETPVLPINPSPYSPSSRRFRSPLYLRIEDTPEYAAASAGIRANVDALRPVDDEERIDRDVTWTAKLAALELLWPQARPAPS